MQNNKQYDFGEHMNATAQGALLGGLFGTGNAISSTRGINVLNPAEAGIARQKADAVKPVTEYDVDSVIKQHEFSTGIPLVGKNAQAQKNTVINDSVQGHTQQQNAVIFEYKNAVNQDLADYIKTVRESPSNKYMSFTTTPVSLTEAAKIKEITGVDVTGFEHNIKPNAIQHIDKRHGINGIADRSMANVEDMARIDYVLNNAESISPSFTKKGQQRYSDEFKNSDGYKAKTILYSKAIDGTFYVVEAVPDSKAKKLQLVSAYISKNKKGAYQVPDTHPKVFPRRTSENELEFTPYNDNIPQGNSVVNSYDMQESGGNAGAKPDVSPILNKLKASIPDMTLDAPVKTLIGNEFPKSDVNIVKQVGNFFKALGNKVTRQGFGDIVLDEAGVQSDIAHGLGRAKSVTFAAVPEVIKQGKQIDYQPNWKGRGRNSYVFAAPIAIDGKRSYVTVVVLQDKDNRLYLHEVLDGNGDIVYIKKEEPGIIKTGITVQDGITSEPSSSYDIIIPQADNGVNSYDMQGQAQKKPSMTAV